MMFSGVQIRGGQPPGGPSGPVCGWPGETGPRRYTQRCPAV